MQAAAKTALQSLVEEHLTSLIGEAATVQRHAKRARLVGSDSINGKDEHRVIRRRVTAQDVNLALAWRGSEKIYATAPNMVPDTKRIDLNAYLQSESQTRPPSELGLTLHWLAVDGEQPDTPYNPVSAYSQQDANTVHHVDDEGGVKAQQLMPRVLSEELQLYGTRITQAVERGGATPATRQQQDAAIASLYTDSGLQELAPFLVHYVVQNVYQHVHNPEHCRTLVRLARAILSNPHLHLELHLPQLLSALVTCTVAKNLSSHPSDNQWALRIEAAQALNQACALFGDKYTTLKARLLKTLVQAVSSEKPLATQFGGITAISLFGPKAIDSFLLPITTPYWEAWETALDESKNEQQRDALRHCQQAMLDGLSVFFQNVHPSEIAERLDRDSFVDTFGERLIPLQSEPTDYTMCVI